MTTQRLDSLEKKVEQLTRAVNELQSKLDYVQSEVIRSSTLEQLSMTAGLGNSESNYNQKIRVPESMKPVVRELAKEKDRWLSAKQIAESTKRSRNVESSYLQRLFEKGYLIRQRSGRNVYYSIRKEMFRCFLEE